MLYILKRYLFMQGTPRGLKITAFITTLGIALSVAVLMVTLSVAAGFEEAYKRSILDFNAHIVLLKEGGEIGDYESLLGKLDKLDGITGGTPFIYRETMLASKGIVRGAVIKGVDFGRMRGVSNLSLKPFDSLAPGVERGGVFMGRALAERFGMTGQAAVSLLLEGGRFEKISVIGTFESGLYDYDSQFVLMPLNDVRRLFGMGDEVTGIEIRLKDPDEAAAVKEVLEYMLPDSYSVTTWGELNRPIFEAVRLEKIMFTVIIGILVLVGMFNIIGALVLRILYKARDISILSAIGMRPRLLRGIFTFHGTVLGVTGVLIGFGLGGILTYIIGHFKLVAIEPEIYFLSNLPVKMEQGVVFAVAASGLFVSWLVSFIASTKIAELNIADGLRS